MRPVKGSTLIIAEAGVNHNGQIDLAEELIDLAAEAGADVVKFQTFRADLSISPIAKKAGYQTKTTGADESQLDMVRRLELDEVAHDRLIARCAKRDIAFLSTPFDVESIELLRSRKITIGKVPSGEVTNAPYLRRMAQSFKSIIMSTGMCTLPDVAAALAVLYEAGASPERLTLLHCNTQYPTPFEDVNLRAMKTLSDEFNLPVGYSDHTRGIEVPVAAVALGAVVIEKHFTLSRDLAGPDHMASLEPGELRAMVSAIRNVEASLGSSVKQPSPSESENMIAARKSIYVRLDMDANTMLQAEHLVMLRPGNGLSPMELDRVVGRRLARPVTAGHALQMSDLV